ncbi:MAG TPA: SpoIIE family protein phosphatase [Chloroflexota bacterium]
MSSMAQPWYWLRDRARSIINGPYLVSERVARERGAESSTEIAPDDPLVEYLLHSAGPVDLQSVPAESAAVANLRSAGMQLVVPLVNQGELVGVLSLGPRRGDLDYSRDDLRLLSSLAAQAAPALRVAQLVREQRAEVEARAQIDQELQVARAIQQFFLPHELPQISGWELSAHYSPARAVGGDFYDFILLPDNRLGIIIGDVADKGVPAALVMAATRSVLRATVQQLADPAEVLSRVNEHLVPDTPTHIFVTCLYAVLDISSGSLQYANAGHDPPFVRTASGKVAPLMARGLPLGVMPGSTYLSHTTLLDPEDHLLLYSDGLLEAHDQRRQMFGFDRLQQRLMQHGGGSAELIADLLSELDEFVGPGWEQEDDVTLVALKRTGARLISEFTVQRELGQERFAVERIVQASAGLAMEPACVERLRSATSEAIINAIEHSDADAPEPTVRVRVYTASDRLRIAISSPGGPHTEFTTPDLAAKVEGREDPRGWGIFLMRHLADEVNVIADGSNYTVELSFVTRLAC